jgi:hypothetical protein
MAAKLGEQCMRFTREPIGRQAIDDTAPNSRLIIG